MKFFHQTGQLFKYPSSVKCIEIVIVLGVATYLEDKFDAADLVPPNDAHVFQNHSYRHCTLARGTEMVGPIKALFSSCRTSRILDEEDLAQGSCRPRLID